MAKSTDSVEKSPGGVEDQSGGGDIQKPAGRSVGKKPSAEPATTSAESTRSCG